MRRGGFTIQGFPRRRRPPDQAGSGRARQDGAGDPTVRVDARPRRGAVALVVALVVAGAGAVWALGGEVGLDVSSGKRLASERPARFVAGGLWGVGFLCLIGTVVALGLRRRGVRGPAWRGLRLLGPAISLLLLVRGLLVEVLLIAGVPAVGGVSATQRFWTLTVWNPWFVLGGVLFGLATRGFAKGMTDRRRTGGPGVAPAAATGSNSAEISPPSGRAAIASEHDHDQ
ncbi:DUF3995 domain-containing protein [Streptomyces sp. NPDC057939]|uniref:DUF3995 domain-containing protein n=1 Tax=Streptomyces sp. NPDC057939 TaxID=3346284 RepID=UPI0036EB42DF